MSLFRGLFGRSGGEKNGPAKAAPAAGEQKHFEPSPEDKQRLIESGAVACAYMIHPEVIERSPLAQELVRRGLFSVEAHANQLFLPTAVEASRQLAVPLYAERSEPIIEQMVGVLDADGSKDFGGRTLFQAVQSGDLDALKKAQQLMEDLRDYTAKELLAGKLALTPEDPHWRANRKGP